MGICLRCILYVSKRYFLGFWMYNHNLLLLQSTVFAFNKYNKLSARAYHSSQFTQSTDRLWSATNWKLIMKIVQFCLQRIAWQIETANCSSACIFLQRFDWIHYTSTYKRITFSMGKIIRLPMVNWIASNRYVENPYIYLAWLRSFPIRPHLEISKAIRSNMP